MTETGIDPFQALVVDDPLPPEFRERRYPRMVAEIQKLRSRVAATQSAKL
jgi:hypothetical protein